MLTLAELQAARRALLKSLRCPHCDKRLNWHVPLIIATRNCPGCGRQVVAEPEDDSPPPFTPEQLDDACAASRRTWMWAMGVMFAAIIPPYAHMAIFVLFWPTMPKFLFDAAVSASLAGLIGSAVLCWRASHKGFKCPDCATLCSAVAGRLPNLTQLTGNCTGCGRRLAEATTPEEPAGSLPTVAEYEPSATRHFWRSVFGFLMFGAFLIVLIGSLQVIWQEVILTERFLKEAGNRTAQVIGRLFLGSFTAMLVIELAGFYVLYRLRKRRARANPVLSCPHCQAELIPMSKVIASRRCPSCRRWVLAEPEPQPVASEG